MLFILVERIRGRSLSGHVLVKIQHATELLSLNRDLVICFSVLDSCHLLLVLVFHMLLVSDVITDLHLFLNQVLSLDKRANELVPLFFLQITHLVLMNYIGNLKLFLFSLKLMLLIHQLLSQDSLFVIKIQEDTQILSHFVVLFGLDDTFDLALLRHLQLNLIYFT